MRRARAGIALLPAGCRPAILAAALIYAEIGREIERNAYDSVTRSARVSAARKASPARARRRRSLPDCRAARPSPPLDCAALSPRRGRERPACAETGAARDRRLARILCRGARDLRTAAARASASGTERWTRTIMASSRCCFRSASSLAFCFWQLYSVSQAKKKRLERERQSRRANNSDAPLPLAACGTAASGARWAGESVERQAFVHGTRRARRTDRARRGFGNRRACPRRTGRSRPGRRRRGSSVRGASASTAASAGGGGRRSSKRAVAVEARAPARAAARACGRRHRGSPRRRAFSRATRSSRRTPRSSGSAPAFWST